AQGHPLRAGRDLAGDGCSLAWALSGGGQPADAAGLGMAARHAARHPVRRRRSRSRDGNAHALVPAPLALGRPGSVDPVLLPARHGARAGILAASFCSAPEEPGRAGVAVAAVPPPARRGERMSMYLLYKW